MEKANTRKNQSARVKTEHKNSHMAHVDCSPRTLGEKVCSIRCRTFSQETRDRLTLRCDSTKSWLLPPSCRLSNKKPTFGQRQVFSAHLLRVDMHALLHQSGNTGHHNNVGSGKIRVGQILWTLDAARESVWWAFASEKFMAVIPHHPLGHIQFLFPTLDSLPRERRDSPIPVHVDVRRVESAPRREKHFSHAL